MVLMWKKKGWKEEGVGAFKVHRVGGEAGLR